MAYHSWNIWQSGQLRQDIPWKMLGVLLGMLLIFSLIIWAERKFNFFKFRPVFFQAVLTNQRLILFDASEKIQTVKFSLIDNMAADFHEGSSILNIGLSEKGPVKIIHPNPSELAVMIKAQMS